MKVLFFMHTFGEKNGIAMHAGQLISHFPPEVRVQAIHGGGISFPLFSSLRLPVGGFFKALSADFDVMHIHGYGNFHSFFGAWAAILRNKPLVWTIHGYPQIHGARRLFYYVYRHFMAPFIFFKAKRIITVSTNVITLLQKETRKEITFIPNGIDLEAFRPKSDYKGAKYACYVGRLDPDKGVFRMLECSSMPVKFIGPNEDGTKSALAEEAKRRGREITFEEVPFERMPAAYESCRYVALPSKYEGFPMSMLESVAMGRPFICTDVGEVRATLANLFDSPSEFIIEGNLEAKISALEKKDLSGGLAAARGKLDKYSWQSIAQKTAEIYSQAMGGQ
ncbi:MAG: glycosyltransferase family 4 protein [Candidatus Micrarchaeia archaeon]